MNRGMRMVRARAARGAVAAARAVKYLSCACSMLFGATRDRRHTNLCRSSLSPLLPSRAFWWAGLLDSVANLMLYTSAVSPKTFLPWDSTINS